MVKVLMTGFDPFDGEKFNPALEAVKNLDGKQIGSISIKGVMVPTVFQKSIKKAIDAIETVCPDVVICVGQAGGRSRVTVERVAINVDDARIPDNEGQKPEDLPIVENGPVAYWSTLPVKAIVQNLRHAGIPAAISNTAGTFVCNHIFYGVAHYLKQSAPGTIGGFIHVPFIPEQVTERQDPSMDLATITKGLEISAVSAGNYAENKD